MQPRSFFTSSSSPPPSSGSSRSTPSSHLFALSAAAALQPELDPVFPSVSLSSAAHSLSRLSLEQEEARQARLAGRRAAAAAMEERLQQDDEEAERQRAGLPSLSSLPLSPPSPTPSLRSSSAFLPFAAGGQRSQLRPSASRQLSALSASRFSSSRVSSPQPVPASRHAGEGRGALCGGRVFSARQRQQMAFTERLSPTPMEEPEEEEEVKGGRRDGQAGRGSGAHSLTTATDSSAGQRRLRLLLTLMRGCAIFPSAAGTVLAAAPSRAAQPLSSARRLLSSRPSAVVCPTSALSPSPSPPLLPAGSPTSSSNPLLSAILYVHTLISTSPADAAGLRVRDFIVEIAHFSKAAGWTANMLGDVAVAIHGWPAQHPGQPMRIVVLRRVPHELAETLPDVTWARTKLNGSGNGHGAGGGGGGGNGGGNGSGNGKGESVIALQRLVLWPVIGHYQIDEQQGGESGRRPGLRPVLLPRPCPHQPTAPAQSAAAAALPATSADSREFSCAFFRSAACPAGSRCSGCGDGWRLDVICFASVLQRSSVTSGSSSLHLRLSTRSSGARTCAASPPPPPSLQLGPSSPISMLRPSLPRVGCNRDRRTRRTEPAPYSLSLLTGQPLPAPTRCHRLPAPPPHSHPRPHRQRRPLPACRTRTTALSKLAGSEPDKVQLESVALLLLLRSVLPLLSA